jgi:hypothetical protein
MAGPAAIVLRAAKMIKDSGAVAAAKEFSDDVIKQAKKHLKDMKSKKTADQKKTEKATKSQRTYREGQRKAGVGGAAAGYTAGGVDLSEGKGQKPIADMSQGIDVRGDGDGIRYFQDGKEVRMPKKRYN